MSYATTRKHQPVLLSEMLALLHPEPKKIYVDCTFGGGGYTKAILISTDCQVIALDRDTAVTDIAAEMKASFGQRFHFVNDNFTNLEQILRTLQISTVDGIILDLGVSMMQLIDPNRGFSFNSDAYLDMRMDQTTGPTAAELIATADEKLLADIIFYLGGERAAKTIAKNIVRTRKNSPINTTAQLAYLIRQSIGWRNKIDAATKTFQAIRIWVNSELENLHILLSQCSKILSLGGKLLVVSFHSEEDRIVKRYLTELSRNEGPYQLLNKKPLIASYQEKKLNPASRSAKLRGAVKIRSG